MHFLVEQRVCFPKVMKLWILILRGWGLSLKAIMQTCARKKFLSRRWGEERTQQMSVTEYDVYLKLCKLKKTRSTLPIDILDKLRQECAPFLAGPLTTIINDSLLQSVYPTDWKQEWITPAQKITHPRVIKDLRKISSTSDCFFVKSFISLLYYI